MIFVYGTPQNIFLNKEQHNTFYTAIQFHCSTPNVANTTLFFFPLISVVSNHLSSSLRFFLSEFFSCLTANTFVSLQILSNNGSINSENIESSEGGSESNLFTKFSQTPLLSIKRCITGLLSLSVQFQ
ncbi:hypothetical protein C0J52_14724 [Blattella germanica]|nr:hypothetical protein C0J52_14724 [Blattella germanica]